jgi:glyoxylase-like metal-dependent hydrolase (beta-lactamase superfamily II)
MKDSVLVFDTHFTPEAAWELLGDIRSVTHKPVRYVVNSHFHPEYTHGNQVFEGAHIIGSLGTRKNILQQDLPALNRSIRVTTSQLEKLRNDQTSEKDLERKESMQEQIDTLDDYLAALLYLKISAPSVVLEDYASLRDGSMEVRIQSLESDNANSITILFIPEEKIVFCGDLFFNIAIPNVQDAEILPWMETLMNLLDLDADQFVPGHGPPGRRRDVLRFLAYLQDLRMLVEPFVIRGDTVEKAMQEIQLPEKYSRYRFKHFFPSNIEKMYAELKTERLLSIPIEGPQLPKD